MSAPLVSLLLPSLNARRFLTERVDSILDQKYPHWEAIVLDSHSTDGTWEFFQSIANKDERFRLYQIPQDGLYAALNRGFELARGEFLHIATCDDAMTPDFLSEMLQALSRYPKAGVAVCDLRFINRYGDDLTPPEMIGQSKRGAAELLSLDVVRTAIPGEKIQQINFRPAPHDCLLHFAGRSVYCSLNQLLVRASSVKVVSPFETNVGSIGDFDWLLRLTSCTDSVHLPKKLAMWRYHGEQLSLYRDPSRVGSMKRMAEDTLKRVCQLHPHLLSENDGKALILPLRILVTTKRSQRVGCWFATLATLLRMFLERPGSTWRGLRAARFRFGTRRYSLIPMIFEAARLRPENLKEKK